MENIVFNLGDENKIVIDNNINSPLFGQQYTKAINVVIDIVNGFVFESDNNWLNDDRNLDQNRKTVLSSEETPNNIIAFI